ncbi:hypothetical protein EI94DRAFT_1745545 [Lactarius quietus]|nr:hypothetical protein EI94DRAFT_1745545 [Lactarius quietus]
MLHLLPTEVTLSVLSYLPLPSLLPLAALSRQWHDFFTTNQSEIFHHAAIFHEYIKPQTMLLEKALSMNAGRSWAGSISWKDFCHRSFQLCKNWDGKGRAVMRLLTPPYFNVYHIKVDEKAGICITTAVWGGLTVIHLFSSIVLWCLPRSYARSYYCDYDNGCLMEVWRLTSDFATEDEAAIDSPPNDKQMAISARAAAMYHQYAPLGQFRPWALLRLPEFTEVYRLVYPTLICANFEHAFLHDVRTGSLVQVINTGLRTICNVDVNERHAFVCEEDVVHVFSLENGSEVLCIPAEAIVRCSQRVEDPYLISGDWFIKPLSVSSEVDEFSLPKFTAARVSRDGRDLVVLSGERRLVFIQDFERIYRGEITLEQAALVLGIPNGSCFYLAFEHGRVCVATVQGHYIFTFGSDRSVKAVYVRSINSTMPRIRLGWTSSVELTDGRIYFMLDERRRRDIPLFKDEENSQELPPPIPPTLAVDFEEPPHVAEEHCEYVGCIDFTLMPKCDEERPEVAKCPQLPVLVN